MERLLQSLFAGLVFTSLFVLSNEDHFFYVAPNLTLYPNCTRNQSCLTFDEFIVSYQFSKEHLTLVFLEGYHTLTTVVNPRHPSIYPTGSNNWTMIGLSTETIIYDVDIILLNIKDLQITNLTLIKGRFSFFDTPQEVQIILSSVTFLDFVLYISNVGLVQLNDCDFLSGSNPLTTHSSRVILSGNSQFLNNYNSALVSYDSTIALSGTVSFINNTGIRGGAMALYSSVIYMDSLTYINVIFINNSAEETGGAIHIEPDMTLSDCPECLYVYNDMLCYLYRQCPEIAFYYFENSAKLGGDNIYGTSLALCEEINELINSSNYFSSNVSMSSVSSDPRQVCLCDSDGQPQCNNVPEILTSKRVHPGETFTISAVLVGGDYGTTIGTVHANFAPTNLSSVPVLETSQQYSQWINNISVCTDLEYTVYTRHTWQSFTMFLTVHSYQHLNFTSEPYTPCGIIKPNYNSSTPTVIDLTMLPCPMGFSLLENPFTCDCHPTLTHGGVKCSIINRKSYFSWNTTLWINITNEAFTYAKYCPLHYCNPEGKQIELEKDSSIQCAFNRAGRLCGGCKDGYSLAIGSSHCIHCPNNNNLALLIFFAAAGICLVVFINILDITLTQGLVDGLIFYANVVWTYQSVLFPEEHNTDTVIIIFKIFIAWLNLDFGIETCFVRGLTVYWKTWLQFVFPFYIWAIVGLMILTARHSKILTRIYGNRAVPVLATLFLLSYMKLLRTITSIFMLSHILQYPKKSTVSVWSVDGNIDYFGLPHSLLLVAALIVQIFLWLPYTLTLLFHQQLQKISHIKLFNWVTNLKPFFDVHFAPFKPAHRYWFGVLLLARGILLAIYSSSFASPKNTNLLLLLILVLVLLLYMAIVQPYKNKLIFIIQSSFFANIPFLGIFAFYAETLANKDKLQMITVRISIGVVFLQFCGIIICNIIRLCYSAKRKSYRYRTNFEDEEEFDENFSTNCCAYIVKAFL